MLCFPITALSFLTLTFSLAKMSALEQQKKMLQTKASAHAQIQATIPALVTRFVARTGLMQEEAEAVIYRLDEGGVGVANPAFKNTLLALQVFNRYAAEKAIRVEDASVYLRECWADIKHS